jgi:diguanylate cyclase (GGDEF)-like protein
VHAVRTGPSARIAILDAGDPDATLFCSEARSQESRYMYCLLTGYPSLAGDEYPAAVGADDFLPQPFEAEALLTRVRHASCIVGLHDQLGTARERLQFESTHDPVTRTWNRSGLQQHLHREFERASRFGNILGATMVDLDHFRNINENFGYEAGDALLLEVASRIQHCVRAYDIVGRNGADEFIVLTPETSPSSLMVQAQRIFHQVTAAPVRLGQGEVILRASLGVATSEDRSEHELLQAAESAVRRAKHSGRNGVEFAGPAIPPLTFDESDLVACSRPN